MSTNEERLHLAIRDNDRKGVEKFLAMGVSADSIYYGMSPLLVSISTGRYFVVKQYSRAHLT